MYKANERQLTVPLMLKMPLVWIPLYAPPYVSGTLLDQGKSNAELKDT